MLTTAIATDATNEPQYATRSLLSRSPSPPPPPSAQPPSVPSPSAAVGSTTSPGKQMTARVQCSLISSWIGTKTSSCSDIPLG